MTRSQPWFPIAFRIAAAVLGGYVFAWGFTALLVALNLSAGGDYGQGVTLAYLLAFLVYLGAFLWAFAAASLARAWLLLGGGGSAMTALAWWLAQTVGLPNAGA